MGILLSTGNSEACWKSLMFGNLSLKENHSAKVLLHSKDAEVECIEDEKFEVVEQFHSFVDNQGETVALGPYLKAKQKEAIEVYPISTRKDLLKLFEESDKLHFRLSLDGEFEMYQF